jgi:hypothetical protein
MRGIKIALTVFFAGTLAVMAGCGRETPEPVLIQPADIGAMDLLRLSPGDAWLTVAFPSADHWYDQLLGLAKTMAPPSVEVDLFVQSGITEWARILEVKDAQTFSDLAQAVGINPEGAFAFYYAADTEASDSRDEPSAFACVAQCTDSAVTDDMLARTMARMSDDAESQVREVTVDDIVIRSKATEDFSYFVHGQYAAFGTSEQLVLAIAKQFKNPADIRYGSPECPATSPNEIVALAHMDRLVGGGSSAAAGLMSEEGADVSDVFRQNLARWSAEANAYAAGEPAVISLRPDDAGIELLYRIDGAAHPKVAARYGDPKPLRLTGLLPAQTEAFMALRLNAISPEDMQDRWLGLMPEDLQSDPLYGLALQQLEQTAAVIGDEFAVGITGITENEPGIVALMTLKDEAGAKDFFGAFTPFFTAADRHGDTEIMALPEEMAVPMSFAIAEDLLVVGPSTAVVKGVLEQTGKGTNQNALTSLDPPLDPAASRKLAIVAPQRLLTDLAIPLTEGNLPPPVAHMLSQFASQYREIRAVQEVRGTWLGTRISFLANR